MFPYYLSTLHKLREKNLQLGQATTQAWLDLAAHIIDGQYLVGHAILNQPVSGIDAHHPGGHWEREGEHQQLALKWANEAVARTTKVQEIIFAAVLHSATNWQDLGHELLNKLQHDVAPEYADALKLIEQAMQDIASAESAAKKTANGILIAPSRLPAKKPPTKKPAAKKRTTSSVKNSTRTGKDK